MILVTGGAGYIGSFTVKELLDNGYEVVVLDSLETGHKEAIDSRAKLEIVDLEDAVKTARVFDKYKIEAVIDFAAYLAVGESMENPKKYMKNNVENFVKLLDVMRDCGCKYIIKSSTASVYGDSEAKFLPLKENYQTMVNPKTSGLLAGKLGTKMVQGENFFKLLLNHYEEMFKHRLDLRFTEEEITRLRIPTSVYGLTKLMDEIILEKYEKNYGVKSIILRYFNVCGANFDGSMGDDKPIPFNLMSLAITNILGKTEKLKIFGNDYPTRDGTGLRDYIHPIDLASGHRKALDYILLNDKSEIFNLGTGQGYTVFEVIQEIDKASGKKVSYEMAARRAGDPSASYADAGKAEKLLGWKAKYDLKDMAESAWKWHSKHPNGYVMKEKI